MLSDDETKSRIALQAAEPQAQLNDGQAFPPVQVSPLDATVSIAPAGARPPPATPPRGIATEGTAFPVPGWDRYQPVGFLGQGGMGRVFLAYDPRLRRQVALKFVRDDHPELTHRFLSEARAQAKVNHERVCKVYEVGQVDQKFFIAMQYVEGRPLSAFVREITVEQKALVLRDAALGVHEAHRAGLIHRDLKPSNILVERGEDGVPRPYVMDFGLARDWKEGVTVTGTVLGTPHYMAPEQARGEVARLDHRADVYSLGATLYALLTGQPPIQGSNGLEVLNNLATVEPRPPRALDRNIPPDLEAITLKCLEKEPSARYDSARELAEDLNRFLAGEPVLARTGPGYRLRKRLRKHRLLLSATTAALLAVAVAVGWAVTAREAAERERLSRHLIELVDRIESKARYSALSPLHDTREDREAIQALYAQMEELEAEIRQRGERAPLGLGNYALGRGALILGEAEKARRHLELAWQHGFREPKAAYTLGLALGLQYQQQFLEVEKSFDSRNDAERRQSRLREIERRYRDPALVYLKQAHGVEEPSAEYIAALIAFYEGRLDDALALLDTVLAKQPWLYEASKLRGDIFVVQVYKRSNETPLYEAKADFEAGRKAYTTAANIAESVPALYLGMAQLEHAEIAARHGDPIPAYYRAHDALKRCLEVSPDDYLCWVQLASLHNSLAVRRMDVPGQEVEEVFAKAIEAAERALALAPTRREARMVQASTFHWLALHQRGSIHQRGIRGPEMREQLRKATDMLDSIRPEDRDLAFHDLLANVWWMFSWIGYEAPIGRNSLGYHDRAIQEHRAALAIDDRVSSVWMKLSNMYFTRASSPLNSEPEFDLVQGLLAYEKARSLNPKGTRTLGNVGGFFLKRAQQSRKRGEDPMPYLMRALEHFRNGLASQPAGGELHLRMGMTLQEQAQETWARRGDPFPLLDQAREAFEQGIRVEKKNFNYDFGLGTLLAQRARYLRARGEDPGPSVREAEKLLKHGLEQWQDDPDLLAVLGSAYISRAGFNVDRGRAPGPDLASAENALRRALAYQDNEDRFLGHRAEAWIQLGEAQALGAVWRARNGMARTKDFEEAAKSYEKAMALEPDALEFRLRLGQHCASWATWQKHVGAENGPMLKRGIELVDQVLKLRPDWVEAQALRASLLQASQ